MRRVIEDESDWDDAEREVAKKLYDAESKVPSLKGAIETHNPLRVNKSRSL